MGATSDDEHTLLTSIRYAGTIISTLLIYGAMWCWVGIDKDSTTFGPSDAPIFRNVALLTLAVGGLCSLIFHFLVKLGPNVDEKKPHSGNVVIVTDGNQDMRKDAETALSNQQVGAQEEICSE